jgi:hypothetical protein
MLCCCSVHRRLSICQIPTVRFLSQVARFTSGFAGVSLRGFAKRTYFKVDTTIKPTSDLRYAPDHLAWRSQSFKKSVMATPEAGPSEEATARARQRPAIKARVLLNQ